MIGKKKTVQKKEMESPVEVHALPADDARIAGRSSFPIVGIGASAGGLEAFTQLLQHLPRDTGMAFVLVQHLDPGLSFGEACGLLRGFVGGLPTFPEAIRLRGRQASSVPIIGAG